MKFKFGEVYYIDFEPMGRRKLVRLGSYFFVDAYLGSDGFEYYAPVGTLRENLWLCAIKADQFQNAEEVSAGE